MQTSTHHNISNAQPTGLTSLLSDRVSHAISQSWLAEGLITLGVLVMIVAMFN